MFLFFKIILATLGDLHFHMHFIISLLIYTERKFAGILNGIILRLYVKLEKTAILTVKYFKHEVDLSLYVFRPPYFFFIYLFFP